VRSGTKYRLTPQKFNTKTEKVFKKLENHLNNLNNKFHQEVKIFPENTDETITLIAGNPANNFNSWTEIQDNNSTMFSSKFTTRRGYFTTISIEDAKKATYLIEFSSGDEKRIVARIRFNISGRTFPIQIDTPAKFIEAGEKVYYRMMSSVPNADCDIYFSYHNE